MQKCLAILLFFTFTSVFARTACDICLKSIVPAQYTRYYLCDHYKVHFNCAEAWAEHKKFASTCHICNAFPIETLMYPNSNHLMESLNYGIKPEICTEETLPLYLTQARTHIKDASIAKFVGVLETCTFDETTHYKLLDLEAEHKQWGIMTMHMNRIPEIKIKNMTNVILKSSMDKREDIVKYIIDYAVDYDHGQEIVNAHIACIHERQWHCSDVFMKFYISKPGFDMSRALIEAVKHRITYTYFQLKELKKFNISDKVITEMLMILVEHGDWHILDIVWNAYVKKDTVIECDAAQILLERVYLLAPRYVFLMVLKYPAFTSKNINNAIASLPVAKIDLKYDSSFRGMNFVYRNGKLLSYVYNYKL